MASRTRTVRLALGPGAIAVLIGGVALGWVVFGTLTSARQPIGWFVASAIVAAILEPIVSVLDRHLPRALAVLAVFVLLGAVIGSLTFGVLHDLDEQVERLKDAAPEAAAELEDGDGVLAETARDIELQERVERAVRELEEPSSGVAAGVATSVGAFVIGVVLTAFLLSWGPRMIAAGLRQIADDDRRARADRTINSALGVGRRYVLGTLGLAIVTGLIAGGLCALEDVRAPIALGVAVAAGSVVPGVGVVIGGLPAILLEAGLGSGAGALRLTFAFLVLQAAHELVLRRFVVPRSVLVGPAVILIALVVGFELYGVGGAYYGAALAVFGVAALDAAAREEEASRVTPSS